MDALLDNLWDTLGARAGHVLRRVRGGVDTLDTLDTLLGRVCVCLVVGRSSDVMDSVSRGSPNDRAAAVLGSRLLLACDGSRWLIGDACPCCVLPSWLA